MAMSLGRRPRVAVDNGGTERESSGRKGKEGKGREGGRQAEERLLLPRGQRPRRSDLRRGRQAAGFGTARNDVVCRANWTIIEEDINRG